MNKEDQRFEELVDHWIYEAVSNGVTNFNSLLNSLPGVYPSVALSSLKRLIFAGKISEQLFSIETKKKYKNEDDDSQVQTNKNVFNLPVPHPLDFDWRFSDAAATYLLNYCLEVTKAHETTAFLGTPSVFQKAKEISFKRDTILLDNNSAVINHFSNNTADDNIRLCDIVRDNVPAIEVSTVVVDPPWYENHLYGFMWTAAKICRLDGHILVSFPPVGTRPGVESELKRLFEWLEELGLVLIKAEPGILPYTSPPFEINALKAENFHDLDREWRRGDLFIFVKKEHLSVERPLVLFDSDEKWSEVTVQGVRIKLKPYKNLEFKDPKLLTVTRNNIFPTVSRREPRRHLIEVWTSGNRVFGCQGRFVLNEVLRGLASEQSAITSLSEKLNRKMTREEELIINKSKKQMLEIINTEREENHGFINGNSK